MMAPSLPAAAEMPWKKARTSVGNTCAGVQARHVWLAQWFGQLEHTKSKPEDAHLAWQTQYNMHHAICTHLAGHQEGGAVGTKLVEEGAEEVERLEQEGKQPRSCECTTQQERAQRASLCAGCGGPATHGPFRRSSQPRKRPYASPQGASKQRAPTHC